MNKDILSFSKQQQVNSPAKLGYNEKVPWKLGRHVKPYHKEKLEKIVKDYKQNMTILVDSLNQKAR